MRKRRLIGTFFGGIYKNGLSKWRIVGVSKITACTVEQGSDTDFAEYDEMTDTYWCPAGWYEHVEAETGLDYSMHWLDENFTHFMHLPQPPEETEGRS